MFTVEEIIKATEGQLLQGPSKASVKAVSIDSRLVKKGQLFIAIKGDIFDGHEFIANVIAKGVRVLVVHKSIKIADPKVTVIQVKDTIRALGHLARFHRLRLKTYVIALTGSAGKTTTKEMIATVLAKKYRVLKNEGTQNNHIGVPVTLLKLKPSHQVVVLECGTNQPGDIPWLADVARPDVAVFTNIGESHLEKLKTPQGVLKEKWALTKWLKPQGVVVVNADDPLLSKAAKKLKGFRVITYGIKNESRFRAKHVHIKENNRLSFAIDGKNVELNSCGINNVYNGLVSFICGRLKSVEIKDIVAALKNFDFPKGRGQIVKLGGGWLINDSYNANPVSMRCAIDTLKSLKTSGKRIMVAADMLELGSKTKELHQAVGRLVARSGVDVLVTVGTLSRHMASAARQNNRNMSVYTCIDAEDAKKRLAKVLDNGDVVLVKGSRRMAMEKVVDFLLMSP